ncbi:MAG: helix-turn-helix transcriptional regulator [Paucimonas sp.]|jgi:DNA-binding CsgD family transcriptional regulator|nr:helix-turn-helix transcriptional regulator [Paucimonas sp.]
MSPHDNRACLTDSQLYQQLGELIASTGSDAFAQRMLRLVDAMLPVQRIELSEWTLDARQTSVSHIEPLGLAGLTDAPSTADCRHHPLLQRILQMKDSLLVEFRAPPGPRRARHSTHQCNLVSHRGDKRWVICLQRRPDQRAFSLGELSQLKRLSDTLLPLVEHHAQIREQDAAPEQVDAGFLRQTFDERLAQDDVSLSAREQEVCMGLLTGGTVPQLARRLNVKSSSIETYLKRATAKLGVSGRHGLTKWMAGEALPQVLQRS